MSKQDELQVLCQAILFDIILDLCQDITFDLGKVACYSEEALGWYMEV